MSLVLYNSAMLISIDPATGEEIGRVPLLDASGVAAAVARARAAQPAWARLSYRERARFILRAREVVLERLEEIAKLISREPANQSPKQSRWRSCPHSI